MKRLLLFAASLSLFTCLASADAIRQTKGNFYDAFRQLDVDLPSPNVYRTASGAPGHEYWQQRADYKIDVSLDETKRRITGTETITYTNNSPDTLRYIWLQLDQNRFAEGSGERVTETSSRDQLSYQALAREQLYDDLPHGHEINSIVDSKGKDLKYTIVDTMLRIDLPKALEAGDSHTFTVDWAFNIVDNSLIRSRNGYERFTENDTYVFFLAQWFPRLVAYTDYDGWHNKQFLGRGEFTLEFGDYEVAITVPEDHIVSATGELQNPNNVLTREQRDRLDEAGDADKPVFIVTPEEALENEKEKSEGSKTWRFKAENVRDFAWASSRKFIWDAMIHRQEGAEYDKVLSMSFYPNEAMPIWATYSTEAVVHTMEVYSRFSFDYPYPTSQSVNTWKGGGMEYPMITFNGYRPEPYKKKGKKETDSDAEGEEEAEGDDEAEELPDSTYSRRTKTGLIGVIIHEIGHIYFPMVVNSDERQWTWMDEGINSFLQYVAETEWEEGFRESASGTGNKLDAISGYMKSQNQVPIMTQSDSVLQFGPNAYAKPASALLVLRETVMGRELFDFAFREYAQRWKFKRPTPSDFFRTLEDASGIDLDWFWRGWFYSTDHVDLAIEDVREYQISSLDPDVEEQHKREKRDRENPEPLPQIHNREQGIEMRLDRRPELADFYNENDPLTVTNKDRNKYRSTIDGLKDWEKKALDRALEEEQFIYFVDFKNVGGLVMPIPLDIENEDGSTDFMMIPAEIWRRDYRSVTKMLIRDQPIKSITLDPRHEIADGDYSNNRFPSSIRRSRLELYKSNSNRRDMMADMLEKLRPVKGGEDKDEKDVPLESTN